MIEHLATMLLLVVVAYAGFGLVIARAIQTERDRVRRWRATCR